MCNIHPPYIIDTNSLPLYSLSELVKDGLNGMIFHNDKELCDQLKVNIRFQLINKTSLIIFIHVYTLSYYIYIYIYIYSCSLLYKIEIINEHNIYS